MARSEKWLIPRIVRLRDAPDYLGMDRNRFNVLVRPYLTEIPIGIQGIGFDRLDIDSWADHYKAVRGRPPEKEASCLEKERRASLEEEKPGISISKSRDTGEFEKAVERLALKRRSGT